MAKGQLEALALHIQATLSCVLAQQAHGQSRRNMHWFCNIVNTGSCAHPQRIQDTDESSPDAWAYQ